MVCFSLKLITCKVDHESQRNVVIFFNPLKIFLKIYTLHFFVIYRRLQKIYIKISVFFTYDFCVF